MYDTVSELYNKVLDKYCDEYDDLEQETKDNLEFKFKPISLKIKGYGYIKSYNENILQQFHQVIIIMEENMIVIRDSKYFLFLILIGQNMLKLWLQW